MWSKRATSREFCGVLLDKNGPFASCIKANEEEARDLYQSCVDDVCSYEDTPEFAMKTACMAGETLAELCLTKGLGKVVWRRSDFCRKASGLFFFKFNSPYDLILRYFNINDFNFSHDLP